MTPDKRCPTRIQIVGRAGTSTFLLHRIPEHRSLIGPSRVHRSPRVRVPYALHSSLENAPCSAGDHDVRTVRFPRIARRADVVWPYPNPDATAPHIATAHPSGNAPFAGLGVPVRTTLAPSLPPASAAGSGMDFVPGSCCWSQGRLLLSAGARRATSPRIRDRRKCSSERRLTSNECKTVPIFESLGAHASAGAHTALISDPAKQVSEGFTSAWRC